MMDDYWGRGVFPPAPMGQEKAIPMRMYICTDLEGVACVAGEADKPLFPGSKQYEFARKELTREVNAAIRALKESGVHEIIVEDGHGDGTEVLIYDELLEGVKILLGVPRPRQFPPLDSSFAGVLLIGYHPMAGSERGCWRTAIPPGPYRTCGSMGVVSARSG